MEAMLPPHTTHTMRYLRRLPQTHTTMTNEAGDTCLPVPATTRALPYLLHLCTLHTCTTSLPHRTCCRYVVVTLLPVVIIICRCRTFRHAPGMTAKALLLHCAAPIDVCSTS